MPPQATFGAPFRRFVAALLRPWQGHGTMAYSNADHARPAHRSRSPAACPPRLPVAPLRQRRPVHGRAGPHLRADHHLCLRQRHRLLDQPRHLRVHRHDCLRHHRRRAAGRVGRGPAPAMAAVRRPDRAGRVDRADPGRAAGRHAAGPGAGRAAYLGHHAHHGHAAVHVAGDGQRQPRLRRTRPGDAGRGGRRPGTGAGRSDGAPGRAGTTATAAGPDRATHAVQYAGQPAGPDRPRPGPGPEDARPVDPVPARHPVFVACAGNHPGAGIRAAGRLPGPDGRAHGPAPQPCIRPAGRAAERGAAADAAAAAGGKCHRPRPGTHHRRRPRGRLRAARGRQPGAVRQRHGTGTRCRSRQAGHGRGPGQYPRTPARPVRRTRRRHADGGPRRRHARLHHLANRRKAMTTALIAEDEPILAATLAATLNRLWPELAIVATCAHGQAALERALELKPDVLFLDIKMPGKTGLEAAEELAEAWPGPQPFPQVVFVTAYDDYAVQAFDNAAADYVLKPVSDERLGRTVARLKERLKSAEGQGMDALMAQLRALAQPAPAAERLSVIRAAVGNTVRMIPIGDVLYFEALDKYVNVVTADGEALIRTTLKELLPQLDDRQFWQVHRGTIVNAGNVLSAHRDDAGKVALQIRHRPERVRVSPLYAHLFRQM